MAEKAGTTKDKAAEEKKTRKVLTPAERIAAARQAVADLEAKEQGKAKAKLAKAEEVVTAAEKRVKDAQSKLDSATAERDALKELAGEDSPADSEPLTV